VKNSFTLIETLLALTLISILIGGYLKTSYDSKPINFHPIQNAILLNTSTNLDFTTFDLSYEHTSELYIKILDQGSYQKSTYKTNMIFLEKLHIPKKEQNLSFKVFP